MLPPVRQAPARGTPYSSRAGRDPGAPSARRHPAPSADPTTCVARIPPTLHFAPSGTSSGRRGARKRRRPGATPIPHAPRPTARRVPDRISTAVSAEVEERRAPSLPTSPQTPHHELVRILVHVLVHVLVLDPVRWPGREGYPVLVLDRGRWPNREGGPVLVHVLVLVLDPVRWPYREGCPKLTPPPYTPSPSTPPSPPAARSARRSTPPGPRRAGRAPRWTA